MKSLTLQTKDGCKKLLTIFLILILVCSFGARLVATDFGDVKVEQITIDVRGGALTAELYYPAFVSPDDSIPAIIVCHGGGVNYGVMKPMAQELSRRGFVVLNMNSYNSGLSEQPLYDEGGQGIEGFNEAASPGGIVDAANYLRSISFVDSTRIGVAGHSAGAVRAFATLGIDSSYFTYNDILINILYNGFAQSFTVEEIYEDANVLASERLNADQLAHFKTLAAEAEEEFNDTIRAYAFIGGVKTDPVATVEVAGHEVARTHQANLANVLGTYQKNGVNTAVSAEHAASQYLAEGETAVDKTWYSLNDADSSSLVLGTISDRSEELSKAAQARNLRIYATNVETHSENFFSFGTNANLIDFFEVALEQNSGMESSDQLWLVAAVFRSVALFAMLAMMFPFVMLLSKNKFFEDCVAVADDSTRPAFNKAAYWIVAVLTIAVGALGIYKGNPASPFYNILGIEVPYFVGPHVTLIYLYYAAGASVIFVAIFALLNKKAGGETGLKLLNNGVGIKGAFKGILMSFIFLCFAYTVMLSMQYLLNEDFRTWMTAFSVARVENWFAVALYALCIFVLYLAIGAGINFTVRKDIPSWLDTVIVVAINSAGIFIIWAINAIYNATVFTGTEWSSFTCSFNMLLMVPVTVYITRKMYNLTKSLWVGASMNTFIVAWTVACSGYNSIGYHAQNVISNFFGLG